MAEAGVDFPLVHSSAENVPLRDESFDVVFCDHGAFTSADPHKVVPEASRLLRPCGLLAFSHTSVLAALCEGEDEQVHPTLRPITWGCTRSTTALS
jgi:ubiquinone/menaquinone biosynthesis C-methylase UbiE